MRKRYLSLATTNPSGSNPCIQIPSPTCRRSVGSEGMQSAKPEHSRYQHGFVSAKLFGHLNYTYISRDPPRAIEGHRGPQRAISRVGAEQKRDESCDKRGRDQERLGSCQLILCRIDISRGSVLGAGRRASRRRLSDGDLWTPGCFDRLGCCCCGSGY